MQDNQDIAGLIRELHSTHQSNFYLWVQLQTWPDHYLVYEYACPPKKKHRDKSTLHTDTYHKKILPGQQKPVNCCWTLICLWLKHTGLEAAAMTVVVPVIGGSVSQALMSSEGGARTPTITATKTAWCSGFNKLNFSKPYLMNWSKMTGCITRMCGKETVDWSCII